MKTYKQLFAENYAAIIKRSPRKAECITLLIVLGIPIGITIILATLSYLTLDYFSLRAFLIIFMASFWILYLLFHKHLPEDSSEVRAKAMEFVKTVVLDDLYQKLAAFGNINPEAKATLIAILDDYVCFYEGNLDLSRVEFNYAEKEERISIQKDYATYYLTNWAHAEGLAFLCSFDKVDKTGQVEKVQFHLS